MNKKMIIINNNEELVDLYSHEEFGLSFEIPSYQVIGSVKDNEIRVNCEGTGDFYKGIVRGQSIEIEGEIFEGETLKMLGDIITHLNDKYGLFGILSI